MRRGGMPTHLQRPPSRLCRASLAHELRCPPAHPTTLSFPRSTNVLRLHLCRSTQCVARVPCLSRTGQRLRCPESQWLSTRMDPAEEMASQVQLRESVSGGVRTMLGRLGCLWRPLSARHLILPHRNICERCPGAQTNNRAELIVSEVSSNCCRTIG